MRNIRHALGSVLLGAGIIFFANGCKVDDRFDISHLNSEVTVKVPPVPLNNLGRYPLKSILSLQDSEYISVDPNGDYQVSFDIEPFRFSLSVPDMAEGGDISYSFDPVRYSIGDLPAILTGKGQEIVAGLSEIEISVQVESGLPAEFSMGTVLETLKGGSVQHRYELGPFTVPSGKSEFVLSERGSGSRQDVTYQQVPDLQNCLSPIPDELIISDLTISASEEERKKVEVGKDYDFTCGVSVSTPLAFTADSKVQLSIPIDAEVNLEQVGLKKAILKVDVYNSIPLDFTVSAYAMDLQGNRSPSIKATVDVPIKGGSVDSPAVTPATVTLTTEGDLRMSGIILDLSASSNASVAGIHFNENQGLELRNAVLSFPEGIQVQMFANQ